MKRVMISSTALDLPEHRKLAVEACIRLGLFPVAMEHLPASDADAIKVSLDMVDTADLYLGIVAHRYGYVPDGSDRSLVEMEYDRATARGIPRMIFVMHADHKIVAAQVERDARAQAKLDDLKARMRKQKVIKEFSSEAHLVVELTIALVLGGFSPAQASAPDSRTGALRTARPPLVAHEYLLLQTSQLIGRKRELALLSQWLSGTIAGGKSRSPVMCVVALGGQGKSALAWNWFEHEAAALLPPEAGRFWWSFYEEQASFDEFVIRALAYFGEIPLEIVRGLSPLDQDDQLLRLLDHRPGLIVMDGVERLLLAYDSVDSSRFADDDLDAQTANLVTGALGFPQSAAQSFVGQQRLRQASERRTSRFFKRLLTLKAGGVLMTSRLYPADLQMSTGLPLPGSNAFFLHGLDDREALEMWRAFGVDGKDSSLLAAFRTFENHPLIIQVLAAVVANDRRLSKVGDFDEWKHLNPNFNPFAMPLVQAKSHILQLALERLTSTQRQVLQTIAAFRMSVTYGVLKDVLVGLGHPLATDTELDAALTKLEDHGLLGWNRRTNRYDLHPIVRGVAWNLMEEKTKTVIYTDLESHFAAIPIKPSETVKSIDALSPAIELFHVRLTLGKGEDAFKVFDDVLYQSGVRRTGDLNMWAQLLDALCEKIAGLKSSTAATAVLYKWAILRAAGKPGDAERMLDEYCAPMGLGVGLAVKGVGLMLDPFPVMGDLFAFEQAARKQLLREIDKRLSDPTDCSCMLVGSLEALGLVWALRGRREASQEALDEVLRLPLHRHYSTERNTYGSIAQGALWCGDGGRATRMAERALALEVEADEKELVFCHRLLGSALLRVGEENAAVERLTAALDRARHFGFVREELYAVIDLAELQRRRGNLGEAREALDGIASLLREGPYPLIHADAANVLARVVRDAGRVDEAIAAAREAFTLSMCNGGDFTYRRGVLRARAVLRKLNAPEPIAPISTRGEHQLPRVRLPLPTNIIRSSGRAPS